MRVDVVINARSGRGRAPALGAAVVDALRRAGHDVRSRQVAGSDGGSRDAGEREAPDEPDVLVAVGGDGTVHRLLPGLVGRRTAIYHAPLGTENLFAREFGMAGSPAAVVRALERGRVEAVDAGECNGVPFAIMCSAGPDASIIHRASSGRAGGIRRWSYARPIAAELLRPRVAGLSVRVDGRILAENRDGLVVVANSRCYALGLDPAPRAVVTDGRLDVVFLPMRTGAGLARWMAAAWLGRTGDGTGARRAAGESVEIDVSRGGAGVPVQMDGEAVEASWPLRLRVLPGALRVVVGGSAGRAPAGR